MALIFFVLSCSWLVVDEFFGPGWSVVAAAFAVAIWFIIQQ
jgi:hypothetical protein